MKDRKYQLEQAREAAAAAKAERRGLLAFLSLVLRVFKGQLSWQRSSAVASRRDEPRPPTGVY